MATNTAQKKKIAQLKTKYLEYYRKLPVQTLAAASVGRTDDTILGWRKADSDFSEQVDMARSDWAMENAGKVRSKEWLLERVLNDHFGPRTKTDITSGGDKITPILGGGANVPGNNGDKKTS